MLLSLPCPPAGMMGGMGGMGMGGMGMGGLNTMNSMGGGMGMGMGMNPMSPTAMAASSASPMMQGQMSSGMSGKSVTRAPATPNLPLAHHLPVVSSPIQARFPRCLPCACVSGLSPALYLTTLALAGDPPAVTLPTHG